MGTCHRTAGCRGFGSYSKGGDRIREIGKLLSDFSSIALSRGRPEKGSTAPVIRLNSTSLSPNSFLLSLTSTSVSEHAHPFVALLDSGSSHCFVDELFAKKNKLSLSKLLSTIPLQLFDRTTQNSISHKTTIPLTFSTSETHQMEFYVTKLDKGYSIVLGYDWLVCHNPSIDWAETKVVFSGTKADTLPPHRPYILQISLEEGAKPFHRPIYSLSPPELAALQEFLEEHTWNSFICPTKSPWGAPVLFVKKKDRSLCLCVDFHALNKVMEKDRYPLPLIMDLLNAPGPARIYLKIDLKHAYHLICIAEGDEPKTAF